MVRDIGYEILILLAIALVSTMVDGHRHHGHWSEGNENFSETYTAPNVKCGNTTQNQENFATCELLLSTISDSLGLSYGMGPAPAGIPNFGNSTGASNTTNTTSGKLQFLMEQQQLYGIQKQQAPSNIQQQNVLQNDVCCFLLTFEPMRDRCCKQLARFCEATAGRPNACKCAGQTQPARNENEEYHHERNGNGEYHRATEG